MNIQVQTAVHCVDLRLRAVSTDSDSPRGRRQVWRGGDGFSTILASAAAARTSAPAASAAGPFAAARRAVRAAIDRLGWWGRLPGPG